MKTEGEKKSAKFWADHPSGVPHFLVLALHLPGPQPSGPILRDPTFRAPVLQAPNEKKIQKNIITKKTLVTVIKNNYNYNYNCQQLAEVEIGRSRVRPGTTPQTPQTQRVARSQKT